MMQYLVVLLDDMSVAYCHADNPFIKGRLMPLDVLKKTILFGMKENLMIHFILPPFELPIEYYQVMNTIDHIKVGAYTSGNRIDVCVYDCIPQTIENDNVVIRISVKSFISNVHLLSCLIDKSKRLTINFKDIEEFEDSNIKEYQDALKFLANEYIKLRYERKPININIISDRLGLQEMNSCNAGISNVTVSPDGKFYLCPAFFYDDVFSKNYHSMSIGDLKSGINIINKHLLDLKNAPICRICNAYQCKRCVWLNSKLTLEINTPSHQQCVMANVEHNITCELIEKIVFSESVEVLKLSHNNILDPFYRILNS